LRYRFAEFETIDISPKWPYTVYMTTATKIETCIMYILTKCIHGGMYIVLG